MKHLFNRILLLVSILVAKAANGQESNYYFSHTDSTIATPENIWEVWTDVPNWKQWDKGLKEASLKGDFVEGASGILIPDKGPKSKFLISDITPKKSYTFKTKIPFGWLEITRSLEVKNELTYFTHDVKFTGPLKKILGNKLGENYQAILPEVMREIKAIAESKKKIAKDLKGPYSQN